MWICGFSTPIKNKLLYLVAYDIGTSIEINIVVVLFILLLLVCCSSFYSLIIDKIDYRVKQMMLFYHIVCFE